MHTATFTSPSLALSRPVRWIAAALQETVALRVLALFASIEVRGREQLGEMREPCIFVANHTSHADTLCILRALPWRMRVRLAIPAAADYWFHNPLVGALVAFGFNLVPLQRTGNACGGVRRASQLIAQGWSLLIFPEGTRSTSGHMARFKGGAALLAIQHAAPVVPMKIEGAYRLLPKGQRVPQPSHIVVTIGAPLRFEPCDDFRQAIKTIEQRVRDL